MALSRIRLSLKNNRSAQPTQQDGGAISAAYSQIQQQDQPKVLYQENTIPTEMGLQAAGLVPQKQNYDFLFDMSDANVVHSEVATDINQNMGEMVVQIPTYRGSGEIYMRRNTISTNVPLGRILSITFDGSYFLHKRTTLFQTRTLLLTVPGDTLRAAPDPGSDPGSSNGVYELDFSTGYLRYNAFTDLNLDEINPSGITSHENYLIVFNKDTIYWSSPLNFKEFTPAVGGGGSAKLSEARGSIVTIVPYYNGLMVYCAGNIVSMTFSGDTSNPWIFREVPNSSGLYISNETYHSVPLACNNEQQQVQFALLDSGLHAVTEGGIKPLPESILEMAGRNYVIYKEKGKSELEEVVVGDQHFPVAALQDMFSFGSHLFLIVGKAGVRDPINRAIVYNMDTRSFGTIVGNWRSVHKQTSRAAITSANEDALQAKPRVIPQSYVMVEWQGGKKLRGYSINFQTKGSLVRNPERPDEELREAEVLIGPIRISQDRTTAVHSVSFGTNDALGGDLRVYAFDVTTQVGDTPIEFVLNEADNKYYGYIEGPEVKILLVGKTFHLSVLELEVEEGGLL